MDIEFEYEFEFDYMHDIHRGMMNCDTDITDDSLYCISVSKRCVGSIIIDFHYWFKLQECISESI